MTKRTKPTKTKDWKEEFFREFVDRGELDAPLEGQMVLLQDQVQELVDFIESLLLEQKKEIEKLAQE